MSDKYKEKHNSHVIAAMKVKMDNLWDAVSNREITCTHFNFEREHLEAKYKIETKRQIG